MHHLQEVHFSNISPSSVLKRKKPILGPEIVKPQVLILIRLLSVATQVTNNKRERNKKEDEGQVLLTK